MFLSAGGVRVEASLELLLVIYEDSEGGLMDVEYIHG